MVLGKEVLVAAVALFGSGMAADTMAPSMYPSLMTGAPSMSPSAFPTLMTGPDYDCLESGTPKRNDNPDTNYVVGWFGQAESLAVDLADSTGNLLWPYPFGMCTALDPLDNSFGIFECDKDNSQIKLTKWVKSGENTCDGNGAGEESTVSFADYDAAAAKGFQRKCDGKDDGLYGSYAFDAVADKCENDARPALGVLGVCGASLMYPDFEPTEPAFAQLYCDSDGANMEFFKASEDPAQFCADALYCQRLEITRQCKELFTVTTSSGPSTVFGKMVKCEDGSGGGGDGSADSSAISVSVQIVALVCALLFVHLV